MRLFWAEREKEDGSLLARALLGYGVSEMYGITMPVIEKSALGKPCFLLRPDIHFSLSHTKTCVFCAISDFPVGADTETIRPIRSGLAERLFSPGELESFGFFELWAMRESYYKLLGGEGLNFSGIHFKRGPYGIIPPDGNTAVRLFDDIPGCAAAVCSAAPIPEGTRIEAVKNLP